MCFHYCADGKHSTTYCDNNDAKFRITTHDNNEQNTTNKGKWFSTYIAPQAAYATSDELCVTERAGVKHRPLPALTDFCLQPCSCA